MDKHAHAQHHVVNCVYVRAGKLARPSLVHKPGFELLQSCMTPSFLFSASGQFQQNLCWCIFQIWDPWLHVILSLMMIPHFLITFRTKSYWPCIDKTAAVCFKNSAVKHEPVLHHTITLYCEDRISVCVYVCLAERHFREVISAWWRPIIRSVIKSSDALPNSCSVELSCSVR